MSPARTLATTRRVLTQLRRDPRTIAMLLVVPMVLLWLLDLVFDGQPGTFDRIGPALLALFPFVVMFLVTSVTTLRERTSGTLERLLSMPLGKLDLLLGYLLAFGLVAVVQALLASGLMLWLLDLDVAGPAWLLVLVAVVDAVLGCALGLFVSAFARTEFQAVQFMPAIVLPQFLLCGLLVPRNEMAGWLEAISAVLPLSYAVDAMQRITVEPDVSGRIVADLAIVLAAIVLALALGAATLRRRTA
ncbi:MAG TPA: ABC transporter permease [Gaiella sp.]|uniref:ABC transporter permease n=1 Tax=Gaiella sp. TaxID=2663207 RepID=UPI002D7FB599|nr:ABC transporter permease [Gaiella sp.]HET9286784.1 ABC transporter permease [Gaiella sp.]